MVKTPFPLVVLFLTILALVLLFAGQGQSRQDGPLPTSPTPIACGGEFNYKVSCPRGQYYREAPRRGPSLPSMGGYCAPTPFKLIDLAEELLLGRYR